MPKNLFENIKSVKTTKGLKIWVNPNANNDRIALRLLIMAGSAYESNQELGLAHFTEHLAFDFFSDDNNKKNLAEEIDRNGGRLNAYTGKESTVAVADIPVNQLDNFFALIKNCFLHPDFSEEKIRQEKGVVLDEIRRSEKRYFWEQLYKQVLGNYSFIHYGVGTKDTIKKINAQKAQDFFNKYYVVNNMHLICVGNIDPNVLAEKAENIWSDFPTNEKVHNDYPYQVPAKKEAVISGFNVNRFLFVGFRICGIQNKQAEYYAFWFIRDYLKTRILDFVRAEGLLYDISVELELHRHSGLFYFYANCSKKERKKILPKIKQELDNLKKDLIDEKTFKEYHNKLLNQYTAELTESDLADDHELSISYYLTEDNISNMIKEIKSLTPQIIKDTVNQYLTAENSIKLKNSLLDQIYNISFWSFIILWIFPTIVRVTEIFTLPSFFGWLYYIPCSIATISWAFSKRKV